MSGAGEQPFREKSLGWVVAREADAGVGLLTQFAGEQEIGVEDCDREPGGTRASLEEVNAQRGAPDVVERRDDQ